MEAEPSSKKAKEKKRLSDFEIVRTILQRTHDRKLPYILKHMGEDDDILFLCSEDEEGFVFGSSDMTIAFIEFTDDNLKQTVQSILDKMYGFEKDSIHQLVINVRDQISELSKTKGESIDCEVSTNDAGAVWVSKKDTRGQERIVKFVSSIDSLYHFQMVKEWNRRYRHLLTTQDPHYLYYPYKHPDGDNSTIMTLGRHQSDNHHLMSLYPDGFRTVVTRGIDVIIDKSLENFPYPIESEEMIIVSGTTDKPYLGSTVQIVHRLQATGWRMILVRPNAFFFPTLSTQIKKLESIDHG